MKLNVLKPFFLLAGFVFLLTSCDPDAIIDPPGASDPTLTVSGVPSAEIAAGSTFSFDVTGSPTVDNDLMSIEFTEDGVAIPFSRISIDGNAASANPILLLGDNTSGISWTVTIVAHETAGVKEYGVLLSDAGSNQDSETFDVTTSVTSPSISLSGAMDVELNPGATFSLTASLEMGTYDLASIAVYQGDELITDLDRLAYDEISNNFDANPYLLPEDEKDGGDAIIYLTVQETAETVAYRIVVTDEEGNSSDATINITTLTTVTEVMGVLFNAGGPSGTGGLDLDEGVGTGSSSSLAEIKDEGIDTDQTAALNWIQKISGVNGSEIRYLIPGQSGLAEDFTYESVASQEVVAGLLESGVAFTSTNAAGEPISDVVVAGDMFAVRNGDNNYLIIIREVNVITDSNDDNYVIDIKK